MQERPRLLDQVRDKLRTKHYSIRTEKSFVIGFDASSSTIISVILRRWGMPR